MKIEITHDDFVQEYNKFLIEKSNALRTLYRKWGKILQTDLRKHTRKYTGNLRGSIRYRTTEIKNAEGIAEQIKLSVGLVYKRDKRNAYYLKFILYGSRPHFVPVMDKQGSLTGILSWAKYKGLIKYRQNRWVYAKGSKKGQPFTGLPVKGYSNENYFSEILQKYEQRILDDIMKLIGEK